MKHEVRYVERTKVLERGEDGRINVSCTVPVLQQYVYNEWTKSFHWIDVPTVKEKE